MVVLGPPRYIDGTDKFHNKWMVLSMLVLSLIAFIVPLHPAFHDKEEDLSYSSTAPSQVSIDRSTTRLSDTSVHCWCPNQFTDSYVAYTNTFCKRQYLNAKSGHENASIYLPPDSSIPISSTNANEYKLTFTEEAKARKKLKNQLKELQQMEREFEDDLNDVNVRVKRIYTFQIPLLFVFLALVLLLPRVIWAVLHDCLGVPTPQTVIGTIQNMGMNQLAEDGSNTEKQLILSKLLNPSSRSQSVLHLVNKALSVAVAIVLLAVVAKHVTQEVNLSIKDQSTAVQRMLLFHQNKTKILTDADSQMKTSTAAEQGLVFFCDFEIRQLQRIQVWTVQCVARENSGQNLHITPNPNVAATDSTHTNSNENNKSILEFEYTILGVATALLAILTVSDVLNTIGWLCRLLSRGHRQCIGLPPNVSMDAVLTADLVRLHCGMLPITARRQEKDLEELKLNE